MFNWKNQPFCKFIDLNIPGWAIFTLLPNFFDFGGSGEGQSAACPDVVLAQELILKLYGGKNTYLGEWVSAKTFQTYFSEGKLASSEVMYVLIFF